METVNQTTEFTADDPQPGQSDPADYAHVSDASSQASAIAAERDQLAKQKSELQDILQRRQAEFENFRRRVERERTEVFEYTSMDSVNALLPILDDFERATKVESTDWE